MIDFTDCKINRFKYYGGKNGGKICVIYDNKDYMIKFPPVNEKVVNDNEYSNSCISEYISCHIMKAIGLNVQDTLLGTYNKNDKTKIVVACRDFTSDGTVFKQFAELKNSQIETSKNGYGTELSEVLETIDNQLIYDVIKLKEFFWDMFIADSLVGNFDRHNGNWGFLINEIKQEIKIAPIYDCASCLYPQLTDEMISQIINDSDEMEARVYTFPNSALKINDKKINYFKFISSLENKDCNEALLRIFPNINMDSIYKIIDETEVISDIRKGFYKKILKLRYDNILKQNYERLKKKLVL